MGVRVATWHQPAKVLSPHNAADAQLRSELNQRALLKRASLVTSALLPWEFSFGRNSSTNDTTNSFPADQSSEC